jgi:hypothetical protein
MKLVCGYRSAYLDPSTRAEERKDANITYFLQISEQSTVGKRFSLFYTALCFAGAVAGLISGAVISGLEGARGMKS